MLDAVIFDMDGTIVDSLEMWSNAGSVYLASHGKEAEADLAYKMDTLTEVETAQLFQEEYGIDLSVEEILAEMEEQLYQYYSTDVKLKPGAREFIKAIDDLGIKIALATVTNRRSADAALKTTGIEPYFDASRVVAEVGVGKEEPKIYLDLAKELDADPQKTFVFEDSLYAAKTAKEADFYLVGKYDRLHDFYQDELKEISDYYLKDFRDSAELLNIIKNY